MSEEIDIFEGCGTSAFIPCGPVKELRFLPLSSGIPATIDELGMLHSRSYDLSVTAAGELNIPTVGSFSGGYNRRIVVLEKVAYKRVQSGDEEHQYGYAVRLCVTVNKWDAGAKISLPFLAASAQLGEINAQWTLQVMGLAGLKVDEAMIPPTELNVETFVIAKQSMEKIIAAVRDPQTTFAAELIARVTPVDKKLRELKLAAAAAFGLTCVERGRCLAEARTRLDTLDSETNDAVTGVYEQLLGSPNSGDKPGEDARRKAREILGRIRADV